MLTIIIYFLNFFVFLYFLLINLTYFLLIILSYKSVLKYIKRSKIQDDKTLFRQTDLMLPISLIAPAFNEEQTIVENITALISLNYPVTEVILVNDGSKDETLAIVIEAFQLFPSFRANPGNIKTQAIKSIYLSKIYPNLVVVDKANGGKADALNAGINISRYPIVTGIDTDSLLEKGTLLKMIRPFLENPETIAVGGVVRIINDCIIEEDEIKQVNLPKKHLPRFQIVEYLRSFLFGRTGWEALDMLLIISGAFGMFRKSAIINIGGYRTDTVGEDMDLIVRMHRYMREQKKKYKISFLSEPVCWTEAPESTQVLARQRNRWQRGLLESIMHNKKMLFNPRYGRIGLVALPFALFVEGLGPLVEVLGTTFFFISLLLGYLDARFAIAFLMVAFLLGIISSMSAIIIEELTYKRYPKLKDILILFGYSIVENFTYRYLNVWWRLMGVVAFLRGEKSWGKMTRVGFRSSDK
jgi:cellulose synthase/poly-beta-1,6-N-acetylglucosamine synthase-like glycosyltransferase